MTINEVKTISVQFTPEELAIIDSAQHFLLDIYNTMRANKSNHLYGNDYEVPIQVPIQQIVEALDLFGALENVEEME